MKIFESKKSLKFAKKIHFEDMIFFVLEGVYEPAEDTFLLADHLKVSGNILEIGTGCGILSVLIANKAESVSVIATDINVDAARCAGLNAEINGVSEKIDIIVGDLLRPIKEGHLFDTILFNAPYLPNECGEEQEPKDLIDYAWSGGIDGRDVIDRFIQQAPKYLRAGGNILLVQSTLSNVRKTLEEFCKLGLQAEIVDERKSFFETITLIEAVKSKE